MINDRFKELGALYLLRTRDELSLLRGELSAALEGNAAALLVMQQTAHRISGSGAMLGFKIISEAASSIERILRRADPLPTQAEWTLITAQLQCIEAELDKPTATDVDL